MTNEDMRRYNDEVEKLRNQGWCRLDAERDAWVAWLAKRKEQSDG